MSLKDYSTFQIVFIGVFIFFALVGFIIIATRSASPGQETVTLSVWGTVDAGTFSDVTRTLLDVTEEYRFNYREINNSEFDRVLVEALAEGRGPDMILLPDDRIVEHQSKVWTISYDTYSQRRFRDTFIDATEIFTTPDGIVAFPFMIDPLVMYWNRELFANAGVVNHPTYWDEVVETVKNVREVSGSRVETAGIAFGEYSNVRNAKGILSSLLLQAGVPIVERQNGRYVTRLSGNTEDTNAATSVVRFYTEFANPTSPVYTWNRALPGSRQMFTAGDLGMYIGYASELPVIRRTNPNLNFDVAEMPQRRASSGRRTYARQHGLAILRQSQRAQAALGAAIRLTEADMIERLTDAANLPPVRRDLLSQTPSDAYKSVFYSSALVARSWYDPEPDESDGVFRSLVENVTSGRLRVSDAIEQAQGSLTQLLN